MNLKIIKSKLSKYPILKQHIHWLLINPRRTVPRGWVKLFLNPFFSVKMKGSIIKRNTLINVTPINEFCLGEKSIIENYCVIDNAVGDVVIGSNCRVGLRNTLIGPIFIGDNVILAQNVVLSGMNHNYSDIILPIKDQGYSKKNIIIEDEVWIGANSVLTAGVTVGKHSVVASGSVVTKSVPPYSVVGGNPARILKQYDFERKEWVSVR